jgi:hypothetical protein
MPKFKPYKDPEKSDRRQRKAARRAVFDFNKHEAPKLLAAARKEAKAKSGEAAK